MQVGWNIKEVGRVTSLAILTSRWAQYRERNAGPKSFIRAGIGDEAQNPALISASVMSGTRKEEVCAYSCNSWHVNMC